ncbi:hypothetical protein [Cupriavidus nantongensis]
MNLSAGIPILRIVSVDKAMEFYLVGLGFPLCREAGAGTPLS